jgi:hypothetical protein
VVLRIAQAVPEATETEIRCAEAPSFQELREQWSSLIKQSVEKQWLTTGGRRNDNRKREPIVPARNVACK